MFFFQNKIRQLESGLMEVAIVVGSNQNVQLGDTIAHVRVAALKHKQQAKVVDSCFQITHSGFRIIQEFVLDWVSSIIQVSMTIPGDTLIWIHLLPPHSQL